MGRAETRGGGLPPTSAATCSPPEWSSRITWQSGPTVILDRRPGGRFPLPTLAALIGRIARLGRWDLVMADLLLLVGSQIESNQALGGTGGTGGTGGADFAADGAAGGEGDHGLRRSRRAGGRLAARVSAVVWPTPRVPASPFCGNHVFEQPCLRRCWWHRRGAGGRAPWLWGAMTRARVVAAEEPPTALPAGRWRRRRNR